MNDRIVNIVVSCALGCAAAGVSGSCIWYSRPYRKVKSRVGILLAQLSVFSVIGGLFLLGKMERIAAAGNESGRESAIYAFLFGLFSVGFFVVRSEIRWQRSWAPVRAASERPPVAPEAKRRYILACAFGACSWILAMVYLFLRTKPFAPLLLGLSLLLLLAPMIFAGRSFGPSAMREIRKGVVFSAALMISFIGWVAFRSQVTAPAQTSAWLVAGALVGVVFLAALWFLRPDSVVRNS
jgi:hypothetical protein